MDLFVDFFDPASDWKKCFRVERMAESVLVWIDKSLFAAYKGVPLLPISPSFWWISYVKDKLSLHHYGTAHLMHNNVYEFYRDPKLSRRKLYFQWSNLVSVLFITFKIPTMPIRICYIYSCWCRSHLNFSLIVPALKPIGLALLVQRHDNETPPITFSSACVPNETIKTLHGFETG